jgi:hypothetical protein
MADNILVTPSADSTAVSVKTNEIDGKHWQCIKNSFGADGVATLVDAENPLPVGNPGKVSDTTALSTISVSTPIEDIDTSGFANITIFWNVTAITGTWQLIVTAYGEDDDVQEDYYIGEGVQATAAGRYLLALPLHGVQKIKISHYEVASGTLSSQTTYILW